MAPNKATNRNILTPNKRATTPTKKLGKITSTDPPPVPKSRQSVLGAPTRMAPITVDSPIPVPVTRYVKEWLEQREFDPVYSSEQRLRELEQLCGVTIQPYQHAAHERFPTVAIKFEMERWTPRKIEPARIDKAGNSREPLGLIGSRALLCYHAKADSGKESSRCHVNCLPGLLYEHPDLTCATAEDRGYPTLAWNWKVSTTSPSPGKYLTELLFRACWICTSHGYSHCGISGVKLNETEDKAVSEYVPQSPSHIVDFTGDDDVAASLRARDIEFIDELESEDGAPSTKATTHLPGGKRARPEAVDLSSISPPTRKRQSVSPTLSTRSHAARRHERSVSATLVLPGSESNYESFVARIRARGTSNRSGSGTLSLSGFVPVSSSTLDRNPMPSVHAGLIASNRNLSSRLTPPNSSTGLPTIVEPADAGLSPALQSALARSKIDEILASHLSSTRTLLDQTILGEMEVKRALDSIFAEHESIDQIKAEKVKLKEEQKQLERRVVRFRNESTEQKKQIETQQAQVKFLSSQMEDMKRDFEVDNNLYTDALVQREEMEKERDAAIAASIVANEDRRAADDARLEIEGYAMKAIEEAENLGQRVRDLEIENETLLQEIDGLKLLLAPKTVPVAASAGKLYTPSHLSCSAPVPPLLPPQTPGSAPTILRGLPLMSGRRIPTLPSGVASAPTPSNHVTGTSPTVLTRQAVGIVGPTPAIAPGQVSPSTQALQSNLAEIDDAFAAVHDGRTSPPSVGQRDVGS